MKKCVNVTVFAVVLFTILTFNVSAAAYDNTSHDWYFKPSKNHEPATTEPEFEEMLARHGGVYLGNTDEKKLYLTFDNGYEEGYTEAILDVLKEQQVPAAFFVTGHYLQDQPQLIQRMVQEGHIVGNHSYHHPDLVKASDENIREELESVEEAFMKLTGKNDMRYLRPPRGVFSERTLAITNELGYTNVFWSFAYKDWETNRQKGWKYAYDNIMKRVHPGAILLLHTVSKDNAEALEKVVQDLRKQGYTFHSLDELMAEKTMHEWLLMP